MGNTLQYFILAYRDKVSEWLSIGKVQFEEKPLTV